MSKVVATIYAAGMLGASMLAVGSVTSIVAGYGPQSTLGWITILAFSCIPLGILLLVAARKEWKRSDTSGLALFFVILAVIFVVMTGLFAHADGIDLLLSVLEIVACFAGSYILLKRRDRRGA